MQFILGAWVGVDICDESETWVNFYEGIRSWHSSTPQLRAALWCPRHNFYCLIDSPGVLERIRRFLMQLLQTRRYLYGICPWPLTSRKP